MDYPKLIVLNQKEESSSIQRVNFDNFQESAGTLHVSRELTASEPIEGKIKVAFEGQESAGL